MPDFQHFNCKPTFAGRAKSLKSGADYPTRTDGPLITKHVARLKTNDLSVNMGFKHPQKAAVFRCAVNHITPTRANGKAA